MISITDEQCMSIQICCWADMVHKFDMVEDTPVIAIKGCRVVLNMGKQLNMGEDAYVIFDPPHPRAKDLKEWYASVENKEAIKNINAKSNERDGGKNENMRLIGEMLEQLGLNNQDKSN